MTTALSTLAPSTAVLSTYVPSTNAARIYLASLGSDKSKATMEQSLGVVAHIALQGDLPTGDATGQTRDQRKAGAQDLRNLIDVVPWHDIDAERARTISGRLKAHYDARSYNKTIAALRGVLKAAIGLVRDAGRRARLEASSTEEMMRLAVLSQDRQDSLNDAIGTLKAVNVAGKGTDQATGRMLTLGELMALIAGCQDGTKAGARDAAILGLGVSCGLRRAELAALDLADYDRSTGALTVRHGKGDKRRVVYVTNGARAALNDWLTVRGDLAGAMFLHISKAGRIVYRWDRTVGEKDGACPLKATGMTAQGIYTVLTASAAGAGVAKFSPHDMRRTYVSTLLDNGVDLATTQKLAGHSSPSTTAGYDRRGERAKQDAAKTLHFPYQGHTGAPVVAKRVQE